MTGVAPMMTHRSALVWLVAHAALSCAADDKPSPDSKPADGPLLDSRAVEARPDDGPPWDLNCSFAARCRRFDATGGVTASCYDEKTNPNPCCPGPVHGAITYACEASSGLCLYFSDDCLPSGWVKRPKPAPDGRPE